MVYSVKKFCTRIVNVWNNANKKRMSRVDKYELAKIVYIHRVNDVIDIFSLIEELRKNDIIDDDKMSELENKLFERLRRLNVAHDKILLYI